MRTTHSIAAALWLAAQTVFASPNNGVEARDLTPEQCSKIFVVIDALKLHNATPFCSSFLGIVPTITTTISVVKTTR